MTDLETIKNKLRLRLHIQKQFDLKLKLTEKQTEYLNINIDNLVEKVSNTDEISSNMQKQ